jgi:hypothetical protein
MMTKFFAALRRPEAVRTNGSWPLWIDEITKIHMSLPPNSLLDESLILARPTPLAAGDAVCAALPVPAQDINASVAPNSGDSANFVDIENASGGNWYSFDPSI